MNNCLLDGCNKVSFVEIFANIPNAKSVVSFDVCKEHYEIISSGMVRGFSIHADNGTVVKYY